MSAENPTPNSALSSAGKPIAIILVIVVLLVLGGNAIAINNELVRLDESVTTQWAQVDTVLQRRFDLIPNLVNTVKGYAAHEKEILERVTELRSQWGAAKTIADKAQAAGELEGVLSRLLIVAERYPDLKADQQFRDLQVQLEGTENRIAVERQRYNEAVQAYNTAVRQFPGSVVAGFRGFAPSEAYFKSAEAAAEAPKVNFTDEPQPN